MDDEIIGRMLGGASSSQDERMLDVATVGGAAYCERYLALSSPGAAATVTPAAVTPATVTPATVTPAGND